MDILKFMITISVLIPVYNSETLFSKCIESVLEQRVLPDEILISDDCPEFPVSRIIKKYNSSIIHYSLNSENIGRTKNYKKLLDQASSDYILILDGDDQLYNKDFIFDAKEILDNNEYIAFSGGCINSYEEIDIVKNLSNQSKSINGYKYFKSWFSYLGTLPHSSTIFKKKYAIDLNCYTLDIINTDILSQRMLLLHGDIFLSAKIYSQWNYTGHNSSSINLINDIINNYNTIYVPYKMALKKYKTSYSLIIWFLKATLKYCASTTHMYYNNKNWSSILKFYYSMVTKKYKKVL